MIRIVSRLATQRCTSKRQLAIVTSREPHLQIATQNNRTVSSLGHLKKIRVERAVCFSVHRQPVTAFLCRDSWRGTKTMTTAEEVKHDEEECTFYMQIQRGNIAMLQYKWVKDGVIDFLHTEVPVAYRGMGLAKHLAKAAFDYAVEKDAMVLISCSYLQKYIDDNPRLEYTSRIVHR